jgi:hypothetical protein
MPLTCDVLWLDEYSMKESIKLKYPIMVEGSKLDVIQMRRPKVRDMLMADRLTGSDAEKEINIFANLCELPPEAMEELDVADYSQLQKAYQSFLS